MSRVILRKLIDTVVPAGLATASFLAALLTEARLLALGLAAVTLVTIAWRWVARSHTLGPPRLVLALAVVMIYSSGTAMPDWPLLIAGAGLVGLLLQEGLVYRVLRPLYRTVRLGESHGAAARVFDRTGVYVANTGLLTTFLLVTALQWPAWLLVFAAVAAAAVSAGAVTVAAQRRLFGRGRAMNRLRQLVSEYEPKFLVYFTAPAGSNYQIMMWLPHLEALGERFIVVLREPGPFPAVAAATGSPVIYCPEMSTFDQCVVPSLRAVFYVNNGAKNTHCVRYGELTHVFLNHGDSDKVSSFNPITAMYDRVFVAGQAGIDRYRNNGVDIPLHRFRIVGRPQVASVVPAARSIAEVAAPTVLYAPTWTGHYADANYSSLPIAVELVQALLDRGATVILRHHPYSTGNRRAIGQLAAAHRLLAADADRTGREHVYGEAATSGLSLIECFNRSDALVSDVSSVASEYLYSEKPFAITDMTGLGDGFQDVFSLARVSYVIERDAGNIAGVLANLLQTDPLCEQRRAAKAHYLGDLPTESYGEAFTAEARRCVAGDPVSPHSERAREFAGAPAGGAFPAPSPRGAEQSQARRP